MNLGAAVGYMRTVMCPYMRLVHLGFFEPISALVWYHVLPSPGKPRWQPQIRTSLDVQISGCHYVCRYGVFVWNQSYVSS